MAKSVSNENSVLPQQALMSMLLGVPVLHMITTAAHLGIPKKLEAGPLSAREIADQCGTLEDATYRLMRGLSAVGVLHELEGRAFSLTPIGECLRPGRPGSFDALAKLSGSAWCSGSFADLMHSITTGESAFSKQHGEELFSWFSSHPEEEQLFGDAMSTFSGVEVDLVLSAYDFSSARSVVDVGGGHGMLLARILGVTPAARGMLFDVPKVIERAKATWLAGSLLKRCEAVAGDFFKKIPEGGDLYILKHVLHDWDDTRALQILSNVARAMPLGGKLLVIEQGVAPRGVASPGKILDIVMLALLEGGRERSADDHQKLFEQVGLRFDRQIDTPGPISLFLGTR